LDVYERFFLVPLPSASDPKKRRTNASSSGGPTGFLWLANDFVHGPPNSDNGPREHTLRYPRAPGFKRQHGTNSRAPLTHPTSIASTPKGTVQQTGPKTYDDTQAPPAQNPVATRRVRSTNGKGHAWDATPNCPGPQCPSSQEQNERFPRPRAKKEEQRNLRAQRTTPSGRPRTRGVQRETERNKNVERFVSRWRALCQGRDPMDNSAGNGPRSSGETGGTKPETGICGFPVASPVGAAPKASPRKIRTHRKTDRDTLRHTQCNMTQKRQSDKGPNEEESRNTQQKDWDTRVGKGRGRTTESDYHKPITENPRYRLGHKERRGLDYSTCGAATGTGGGGGDGSERAWPKETWRREHKETGWEPLRR